MVKTSFVRSRGMQISEAIIIVVNENKQRVVVPMSFVKKIEGRSFMQVGTKCKYAPALFAQNIRGEHLLKFTDMFDQLRQLRDARPEVQPAAPAMHMPETLDLFEDSTPVKTKDPAPKRLRHHEPKIVTIAAPSFASVGDMSGVEGISMSVLDLHVKSYPLYVELTASNLEYIRTACKFQIEVGDVKRSKPTPVHIQPVSEQPDIDIHVDPSIEDQTIEGHVNIGAHVNINVRANTEAEQPRQADVSTPKKQAPITNFFNKVR